MLKCYKHFTKCISCGSSTEDIHVKSVVVVANYSELNFPSPFLQPDVVTEKLVLQQSLGKPRCTHT